MICIIYLLCAVLLNSVSNKNIILFTYIFTQIYFIVCYCGRSQRKVPCTPENAMVVYYSCGEPCGKKLSCGNHSCQNACHTGPCEPCRSLDVNRCPCGKQPLTQDDLSNRVSCIQPIPTCGQQCEKPLECGPPGVLTVIRVLMDLIYVFTNCLLFHYL